MFIRTPASASRSPRMNRGYLFHRTGRRRRTGYGLFQKAHKYSIRPMTGLYAGVPRRSALSGVVRNSQAPAATMRTAFGVSWNEPYPFLRLLRDALPVPARLGGARAWRQI